MGMYGVTLHYPHNNFMGEVICVRALITTPTKIMVVNRLTSNIPSLDIWVRLLL